MIFYRFIILLAVPLFCSFYSGAQDSNYVYKDSALLNEDAATSETSAKEGSGESKISQSIKSFATDTSLQQNKIFAEPDSVAILKNSKPFLYAKNLDSLLYESQKKLEKDETSAKNKISWIARFFSSSITTYFFLLLAGAFIFFILYKLFFTEGFFQQSYARTNVNILPAEEEHLSATTDYGKMINLAVTNKNYRMAVRYHYLQSLQKLSSKSAISFAPDKTNYQYLRELSGKKYKNEFASLTLNYEYIWYGEFEIDEGIFNAIQNKFKQFNSGV